MYHFTKVRLKKKVISRHWANVTLSLNIEVDKRTNNITVFKIHTHALDDN